MHTSGHRRGPICWDVTRPQRSALAGVAMAGFHDHALPAAGHRLIPHPSVTLILNFGHGTPIVDDAAGRQHRGSLVAGLGLGRGPAAATWVSGERLACVQVRLSPVLAGAVLGVAPAELDDGPATVEDLWGRAGRRLCERLAEAPRWQERFDLVDAALARRLEAGPTPEAGVAEAWRQIVVSRGRVRVDRLAAELGWSRKRLWSRFGAQIGAPPKQAASLVRFDRAVHHLVGGRDPADVAARTGYADQSHLHREIQAFTGLTPTAAASEPFLAIDHRAWGDPPSLDAAAVRRAGPPAGRYRAKIEPSAGATSR